MSVGGTSDFKPPLHKTRISETQRSGIDEARESAYAAGAGGRRGFGVESGMQ